MSPDTMKAVRIHAYSDPAVLVYEDTPRPRAGDGEVLIRVHAAGINPMDWKICAGHSARILEHKLPLVLGWDVSGVVEVCGSGVVRLKVGDEVFSRPDTSRDGAYAEFMVIKESGVVLKPKSIDHLHAAALPLAGLTAWQCLFDAAGLSAGQRVLIHAAAGGIGNLAVQLAKWKGAHVIGTASECNHEFLRELGIDQVVDDETARWEDEIQPVDVVFDPVGGDIQERSWKVLKRGGVLISTASPVAAAPGVRQAFMVTQSNAAQLAEIARLVDTGQLKAIVETTLPLAEPVRGRQLSEDRHTRGTIVLQVR